MGIIQNSGKLSQRCSCKNPKLFCSVEAILTSLEEMDEGRNQGWVEQQSLEEKGQTWEESFHSACIKH